MQFLATAAANQQSPRTHKAPGSVPILSVLAIKRQSPRTHSDNSKPHQSTHAQELPRNSRRQLPPTSNLPGHTKPLAASRFSACLHPTSNLLGLIRTSASPTNPPMRENCHAILSVLASNQQSPRPHSDLGKHFAPSLFPWLLPLEFPAQEEFLVLRFPLRHPA